LEFKSKKFTDGRLKNDTTAVNYFAFISRISHTHFENEYENFHIIILLLAPAHDGSIIGYGTGWYPFEKSIIIMKYGFKYIL
jgi:hypothetical protein